MLFTTLRHYLGPYRGSLLTVLGLKIVETIAVPSLPTLNADVILVMEHGDIVEQGAHCDSSYSVMRSTIRKG